MVQTTISTHFIMGKIYGKKLWEKLTGKINGENLWEKLN